MRLHEGDAKVRQCPNKPVNDLSTPLCAHACCELEMNRQHMCRLLAPANVIYGELQEHRIMAVRSLLTSAQGWRTHVSTLSECVSTDSHCLHSGALSECGSGTCGWLPMGPARPHAHIPPCRRPRELRHSIVHTVVRLEPLAIPVESSHHYE